MWNWKRRTAGSRRLAWKEAGSTKRGLLRSRSLLAPGDCCWCFRVHSSTGKIGGQDGGGRSDRRFSRMCGALPAPAGFPWCSGYHVRLTRERSPVRNRAETEACSPFFFPSFPPPPPHHPVPVTKLKEGRGLSCGSVRSCMFHPHDTGEEFPYCLKTNSALATSPSFSALSHFGHEATRSPTRAPEEAGSLHLEMLWPSRLAPIISSTRGHVLLSPKTKKFIPGKHTWLSLPTAHFRTEHVHVRDRTKESEPNSLKTRRRMISGSTA